ncbi:MAG: FAD-dependent oxidoreductase [Chloroflexi bacterium]|nr:FAD-dependent oxidoreductase [Chloroflexota bacterium]
MTAVPTPVRAIVYGRGIYLLPRADGTTVVRATYERVGFDKSLTAGVLGSLLSSAAILCPDLGVARFERAWAGLRPGCGDDLPVVGTVPGWDNVTITTGHYRDGIVPAPGTARAIADLVLRGETDHAIRPMLPSRLTST